MVSRSWIWCASGLEGLLEIVSLEMTTKSVGTGTLTGKREFQILAAATLKLRAPNEGAQGCFTSLDKMHDAVSSTVWKQLKSPWVIVKRRVLHGEQSLVASRPIPSVIPSLTAGPHTTVFLSKMLSFPSLKAENLSMQKTACCYWIFHNCGVRRN